jgi:hypothetical protein
VTEIVTGHLKACRPPDVLRHASNHLPLHRSVYLYRQWQDQLDDLFESDEPITPTRFHRKT